MSAMKSKSVEGLIVLSISYRAHLLKIAVLVTVLICRFLVV